MPTHFYVIGPSPYESAQKHQTRENYPWFCDADDAESALGFIFSGMPYPGEATGRFQNLFIPGISIESAGSHEVIQLWSTEEEYVKRLKKLTGLHRHLGSGQNVGIVCEVHVRETSRYVQNVRKLLDPQIYGQPLSPVGANLMDFSVRRHELRAATVGLQFRAVRAALDMEKLKEDLERQQADIANKIALVDAYTRGVKSKVLVVRGQKTASSVPWHVFQGRQFINREIALLANFQDFDFQNMEALDTWLVESGKIWKLLPYEKTILVTRIRDKKKDYHDPILTMIMNQYNFANILWLRNGRNVMRIGVEVDFENAVFPDTAAQEKLVRIVYERVWKDRFKWPREDRHGSTLGMRTKPVTLGLKPRGYKEKEPFELNRINHARFKTMEAWLESESYRPEMDKEIKTAVFDYLRGANMTQMAFLIVLQGLVDTTDLLDIPPGTDLFTPEICSAHFTLVYDYSHGLPDRTWTGQIDPLLDIAQLKVSDWIIAQRVHFYKENQWRSPGYEKNYERIIYQVVQLDGQKVGVMAHPPICRYPYTPVKKSELKWLNSDTGINRSEILRINLGLEAATAILDDRDWKQRHEWLVPVLAQWRYVQKNYLAHPVNSTRIELEKPKL